MAEHRDAIDPLLDGPTARILDLVGADLPPRPDLDRSADECYVSVPSTRHSDGHRPGGSAIAAGGGHRPSRLYAHHSNGLE